MTERQPPPYGYHRSYSSPNLASKAEKKLPRQSTNRHRPIMSAADGYSQNLSRTLYRYDNAVGIEITVLGNATSSISAPGWLHIHDDRHHRSTLNLPHMSQQSQNQQENTIIYQNTSRENGHHISPKYHPPLNPPPSANSQEIPIRQRGESVTSGSSAYTGYNEGSSSPSSQGHNPPLPAPPKKQKTGLLADLKEAPIISRLFVQNDTSPKTETESPGAGQTTPRAIVPPPRPQRTNIPPPINTKKDTLARGSPRNQPAPLPGSSSGNYSPVAAYMTTSHGATFPSSPTSARPATASGPGPGFGPTPSGLASPRLNSSFPEYRQSPGTGYNDTYANRQGRGTVNYGPDLMRQAARPSLDGAPISSISPPARRQTKKRVTATHACMTLHRLDRLKLVKFPPSAIHAVRTAIERSWIKGIQNEKEAAGLVEIQFKGNPWSGQGDDTCPAIYTMSEIMAALYHLGWSLIMATDISKRAMDKDTLIYRQGEIPSPCTFMAVSFNDGDKLRLIKAPNDVINAVKNTWGGNVQRESWKLEGLAWEFKLTGSPWWSSGEESLSVRIILLNMLDAVSALGWELHSSVDITAGPSGIGKNTGSDTDCWILRKVNS